MKLKKSTLLVLVLLCLSLLFSCKGGEPDDNVQEKDFIYNETSELTLVIPEGQLSEENLELISKAFAPYKSYTVTDGSGKSKEHEIIFGESDRELSKRAYRILARQEKNERQKVGYVILSDGKSLAVAYDGERYSSRIAEDAAVERLISRYITDTNLTVLAGCTDNEVVDMIEYQAKKDEAIMLEYWNAHEKTLTEKYGAELASETIKSMKSLYSIYDDNLIIWLIDLYDPDTGGFYYSNSARNNEGYLPDLESTTQALGIIQNSGITKSLEGGMNELIPEVMKEQMVKWVKSLQDPESGYFYHPQWGKKTTDQYPARRGRDLQWAKNILTRFDASPTYDTPLGDKGDGITADQYTREGAITTRLGYGLSNAVSAVIQTGASDAGVPDHLLNDVNFKNYLKTLNITTKSYGAGNTLESQALEIVQRDKVLASRGEKYSLVDILYNFLNENQNKTTGLWQADGATDYNAVNGLLKIASTYTKIGKEVPNALVAVRAAMECIGSGEDPEHVCDVLNPWYAVTIVLENMEDYSDKGHEDAAAIRLEIINDAPRLIEVTRDKVALFVKDDGSFSYYQDRCAESSQGLPTAVPKTNEGDVNATMICSQSIPGHIVTALGLSRIPICTESNRIEFSMTLERLSTIIKNQKDDERESASGKHYKKYGGECYEATAVKAIRTLLRSDYYINYDVGFEYYENDNQLRKKQEFYNIKFDEDLDTNYLEYGKSSEAGHYRGLYMRQTGSIGAECMVFETELKISTVSDEALKRILASPLPYLCDVRLAKITYETEGEVNVNECFESVARIYVTVDEGGEYVYRLGPAVPRYLYSEDILSPAMKLGEWNTVAVELYDNGIAKYYCNNRYFTELKFTDDISGFREADAVRFAFSPDAVNSAVHIDKTFVGKISQSYKRGNKYIDVDGYTFKAGDYFNSFGGYDYSSQPTTDSADLFRASWYLQWKETLDSPKMSQAGSRREGFAVCEMTDASGNANMVAEYCKGSFPDYYNGVYYALNSDAKSGKVYVFETDFRLGALSNTTLTNLASSPCLFDITLAKFVKVNSGDFDQNQSICTIAGVYVTKNEDGNYVYHVTNKRDGDGKDGEFGLAIPAGAWCTLTVEVYEDGTAKYYINGVAMGDRNLSVDSATLATADVLRLSLTESAIRSSVVLDNTFFGKVDKSYVKDEDYIPTGKEYENWPSDSDVFPDNQTILTYENGKVPGTVSSKLVTDGAALSVKELTVAERVSKALVFTTKPGGNDYMNFYPTVTMESFNAISFETDIMITNETGTVEYAIEPITAGSSRAFRLNMKAYDGKVEIWATGLPAVQIGNIGEWIHMRIDYMNPKVDYTGDGANDILYKVYISGSSEPIAVCYSPYNANIYDPKDIATVRFFMFSSTDADICFDNTSFSQLNLEADKAPEQEPPKEPEVEPESPGGPGHTEDESTHDKDGWN